MAKLCRSVCGETRFLDPRGLGGGVDGTTELAGRQRFDRVAAGKQPASPQQQAAPTPLPPPGAQQLKQLG